MAEAAHRIEAPARARGAFALVSEFQPAGDQPQAIAELTATLRSYYIPRLTPS